MPTTMAIQLLAHCHTMTLTVHDSDCQGDVVCGFCHRGFDLAAYGEHNQLVWAWLTYDFSSHWVAVGCSSAFVSFVQWNVQHDQENTCTARLKQRVTVKALLKYVYIFRKVIINSSAFHIDSNVLVAWMFDICNPECYSGNVFLQHLFVLSSSSDSPHIRGGGRSTNHHVTWLNEKSFALRVSILTAKIIPMQYIIIFQIYAQKTNMTTERQPFEDVTQN